ncbi:MAG: CBS domain-containing protein [Alphaproteobacteria bacterium]|nr:CBS domain-containing protein [Alphaproteobacteria bacterium]
MRHNEPVSNIMSDQMLTVHVAQKVSEVYRLLTDNPIHHVPVVNGNELMGLISSTDLMKLSLDAYGTPDAANAEYLDSQFSIDKVMSSELTTVNPDASIRSVAEILSAGTIHSLPVVNTDNQLVGIVTTTDLVNYLLDQY